MIKVAIDIAPLATASKFRGIGMYTKRLIESLQQQENLTVLTFERGKIPIKADLVHYPYFSPFALTLPFFSTKKFVVTIHDLIPLVFPQAYPPGIKGKIKFHVQKKLLKKASGIITDSISSQKDIIKFLGFPEEKVKVAYLAPANKAKRITDKKVLSDLRKKFNLPEKFVLYVGDVNYNKNLPNLVRACRKIRLPLAVVGKQAIQKNFDQNNIENKSLVELNSLISGGKGVLRLGFVDEEDLLGIYSLATVYCQPSLYEGFGLPILEAMACGCPVVTSNVSSLPEVAGEAAVLVDPYNLDQIASGIKRPLEDKKYRQQMIEAGFAQVKKFSWEKVAREVIDVYQKVLAEKQENI